MNSSIIRTLLVYGIVLPLAVMVGWMLSSPTESQSMTVVGVVLFVLMLPLILTHHFPLLIFSWNASLVAFFLPGRPLFWTVMVAANLGMALAYRILQRRPMFIPVPSVSITLLAFAAVVLVTAQFRGGFGLRLMGSESYGSKAYFYVMMGIAGYFAITSQAIPADRIRRYVGYFMLSGATGVVSNLLFYVKPLWFLYLIFPSGIALAQAQNEFTGGVMSRLGGFSVAGMAITQYLLARFGMRGLLGDWRKLAFFGGVVAMSLLGGYRSALVSILCLAAVLFLVEGLFWSRWTFLLLLVGGLGFAVLIPTVTRLPLNVQRTLSMLPLKVDPVAAADARGSQEWRYRIWMAVVPDLPKYLWMGKGYSMNPTEMALTEYSVRRGLAPDYESSLVVGDFHSGPLSLYVPFGLPGVVTFVAFLIAALRGLHKNYKYGPEELRTINGFLLAAMITRIFMFVFIFGSIRSDVYYFTSLIGLSVALNRGICSRPVTAIQTAPARPRGFGLASGAA